MTSTLRTASGRQLRSSGLHETPLPLQLDAAVMPGARILGEDGQIYESMKDWVSGLYEWKVRAQGEPGPALELQKSATHVQWRVAGSTGAWTNLVPLADLVGPTGPQGATGPQGTGLSYQGAVATVGNLPTTSTQGYAYLVLATGDLWIYSGTTWNNAGPIQGPQGPIGPAGPTGPDGKAVELRKTTTEIQWRLQGQSTWTTLVALTDIQGPVGDIGPVGPTGAGFSFQGQVATVGNLPTPSTLGYGFKVLADANLYIWNGTAWVNAGPLQGPKGDTGNTGATGAAGPGFSYQGSLANAGLLPIPSTQGFAYRVGTDLWIYNGSTWVNAGALQGPQGEAGPQGATGPAGPTGPQGATGPAGSSGVVTASAPLVYNSGTQALSISAATTSAAGSMSATDKVKLDGIASGATANSSDATLLNRANHTGTQAASTITGLATVATSGSASDLGSGTLPAARLPATGVRFDQMGVGTAAVAGWDLVIADSLCQRRVSVTAVSSTYTLDVQAGNEFITAAAINGATTINLSNLANVPSGYLWRGVLTFSYTSGTISWFTGNNGYAVKWDGGSAMTPTASEVEKVVIEVVGGTTTIEIAPLKGRS